MKKGKSERLIEDLGAVPEMPEHMRVGETARTGILFSGGALHSELTATVTVRGEEYSFPFETVIPRGKCKAAVIYIRQPERLSADLPLEEIVDSGVSVIILEVNDIIQNKRLMRMMGRLSHRSKFKQSKAIAWCTERLIDYAVSIPELAEGRIAVLGNSDDCISAVAVGLSDDRAKCLLLSDPSSMTESEGRLFLDSVTQPILRSMRAERIVVCEQGREESEIRRLLPAEERVLYHSTSTRHLGREAWRCFISEICKY